MNEWCSELRLPCRHPLDYLIMKLMTHKPLLIFLNALINFSLFFLGTPDCRVMPKPPSKAFGHVENLRMISILVGILGKSSA